MSTSAVSVWTRWGDYVVAVRDLGPGAALHAGAPPICLLRLTGDGTGVVLRDEREVTLGADEPLCFSHEGLDYTVLRSTLSDLPALAPKASVPAFVGDCACVFALLAALVGGPHVAREVEKAHAARPSLAIASPHAFDDRGERTPTLRIDLGDPTHAAPPLASGPMRCGDAEMGDPLRVVAVPGRYGLRGPKDNPDPHFTRPEPFDGHGGVSARALELGVAQIFPGSDAPTGPWGRDDQRGNDELSARGDYFGPAIAASHGEDGFGVEHVPFGGAKSIAILPTAADPAPRVVHAGLVVSGARRASEVGRALASQFGELVRCAHASPAGEARDMALELDIDAQGHVAVSTADDALSACFSQGLADARFSPGAPGSTHVTYPVYVLPATLRFNQQQKLEPAGELCHCGG